MDAEKTAISPMIDFLRLQDFIPDGGTLTLVLKESCDKIHIHYVPKYPITDSEGKIPSVPLAASAETLNRDFETFLRSYTAKEKSLAEILKEKQTAIDKKIEEAKKSPAKPTPAAGKSVTAAKATAPKKESPEVKTEPKSAPVDLFNLNPAPVSVPVVPEAAAAPEEDQIEGIEEESGTGTAEAA